MKKPVTKNKSNSISFTGLLFILFLGLKLAGIGQVANWSWWWVTSPLWIGAVFLTLSMFSILSFGMIIFISSKIVKYIYGKLQSEPFGYLNIESNSKSNVVLDGKELGVKPKLKIRVKPGVHYVIFINQDGSKIEKSVLVVAKETSSIEHII